MIEQLGEYKILKRLDGGGNGTVYQAENEAGEKVAIKILREESGKGKNIQKRNRKKRTRFIIETETVAKIQKEVDGIIPIISYALPDEKTKKYWYAMPIATPVDNKVKEIQNIEDKVKCILELARTLAILHRKEIVHRDIKPKNIYFYNEKYCIGDFGLVDYPERRELTSVQEVVGPRATMAPEMRYNARNADGKKADVYSLAKTLWIILKGIEYGFEGRYEEDDSIIGLRSDERYRKEHLVELEALLKQSTEYDPALRPSMESFVEILEKWVKVVNNYQESNYSEWKYLQNKLFPKTVPLHTEWRDIDSIIKILNDIGDMPGLNHMFLPTGGGQDIELAEYAKEEGCICLVAGGCNYILKPYKLDLENYGKNDYRWSYFRLQLEEIEPISDIIYEDCRELLIEDFPGHYVVSNLINYGRYDDGTEFPKGYRQVDRFLKGAFVAFSKQSVYNHISGTYDARHNKMSSIKFRQYIGTMRQSYFKLKDYQKFLNTYQKNPFGIKDEKTEAETCKRIEESCKFDKFIEENWNKWCFKEICDQNNNEKEGKLEFVIIFHINGGTFGTRKYVEETGYICEEDVIPYPVSKEGKYIFSDFNGAVYAIIEMKEFVKKKCSEARIQWQEMGIYFTIKLFRVKPPSHLFTEEEIKSVLREGNDFRHNRLVISEDGYAQLIDSDLHYEKYRYPVTQESYDARNNYVGKYANLDDINEIYAAMLDGWLYHLCTGQRHDIDYYRQDIEIEKIIKEIEEYY